MATAPRGGSSRRDEAPREHGAAAGAALDRDRPGMRLDDARDDGEAEPGIAGAAAGAPPEAGEDALALARLGARPVIQPARPAGVSAVPPRRRPRRRVSDC